MKLKNRISITAALLALLAATGHAQDGPPKAAVHEVTDTYFGQKIVDPYRWMEDSKSGDFIAWMKAQADYTRSQLDPLPMRAELPKRLEGAAENGEMRVIETATGKDMGERIDRARFGAGAWLPDNHSFLYNRLQKLPEGAPATDLYQKSRVFLHTLGTSADTDRVVFGYEVNPEIKMEPTPLPFLYVPIGWKYVIALVHSGVS